VEEAISKTKEAHEAELSSMQASIRNLEKKVNALEQYDRRLNLVIHGVKDNENEDCEQVVLDVLNNKVKIPIKAAEIQRCHRLGAVRRNGQSRAIIVRFVSYRMRRLVLQKKKILKSTGPQISITENLTRKNLELFRAARNSGKFERVWTSDGNVLALAANDIVKLDSLDDVKNRSK
jgi:hypothetical protein